MWERLIESLLTPKPMEIFLFIQMHKGYFMQK